MCGFDLDDCRDENEANGIHANETFYDIMLHNSLKSHNHKAVINYTVMKYNVKFGPKWRQGHPHIPIYMNKNIFEGKNENAFSSLKFSKRRTTRSQQNLI